MISKILLSSLLIVAFSQLAFSEMTKNSDELCIFPFIYNGKKYTTCTTTDDSACWCATKLKSNLEADITDYCSSSSCAGTSTAVTSTDGTDCSTDKCKFPFKYNEKIYINCTYADWSQAWCATKTYDSGVYSMASSSNYKACTTPSTCNSSTTLWKYSTLTGPEFWQTFDNYQACGGDQQSPINIDTSIAGTVTYTDTFTVTADKDDLSFTLTNSGRNLVATPKTGVTQTLPTIKGGPLGTNTYTLYEFYGHWGKDSTRGSEHTLDHKRYPLEYQFVFKNNDYSTLATAYTKSNGIAIFSVFLESNDTTSDLGTEFDTPVKVFAAKSTSTAQDLTFKGKTILAKLKTKFYSYPGSFTTPNCTEAVTWIISKEVLKIKKTELAEYAKITTLYDNFRPIQRLNNRFIAQTA